MVVWSLDYCFYGEIRAAFIGSLRILLLEKPESKDLPIDVVPRGWGHRAVYDSVLVKIDGSGGSGSGYRGCSSVEIFTIRQE
jgi:hypothetical protein